MTHSTRSRRTAKLRSIASGNTRHPGIHLPLLEVGEQPNKILRCIQIMPGAIFQETGSNCDLIPGQLWRQRPDRLLLIDNHCHLLNPPITLESHLSLFSLRGHSNYWMCQSTVLISTAHGFIIVCFLLAFYTLHPCSPVPLLQTHSSEIKDKNELLYTAPHTGPPGRDVQSPPTLKREGKILIFVEFHNVP